MKVTDIEARLGTRYTAETLARLQRLHPDVRFVWIMGSDNLAQFHRWRTGGASWRRCRSAVLARPGAKLSARFAPAARRLPRGAAQRGRGAARWRGARAPGLGGAQPAPDAALLVGDPGRGGLAALMTSPKP